MSSNTFNVTLSADARAFKEWCIHTQLLMLRFIANGVPEGLWEVWDLQRPSAREPGGGE